MYSDTITLFNRNKSRSGDMWYPTVIHGANLNVDKAAIIAKYGSESNDSAMLSIHYDIADEQKIIDGKAYLPPKAWRNQDMHEETITFKSGKDFDFFMLGEYDSEEPIADDDYDNGFYNHMNDNYDNVFAVTSVAIYSVIPLIEIMGA